MQTRTLIRFQRFSLASVLLAGLAVLPHTGWCQTNGDAPATPAVQAKMSPRTIASVLADMNRTTSITVVADGTVAALKVTPPAEPTTPANLEAQLTVLIRQLRGTTWAKLMLPASTQNRPYKGDDVADFAFAQARLLEATGRGGDALEILGRNIPIDKAEPFISGLNLKPVYLLTNPTARQQRANGSHNAIDWNALTPQQQNEYAQAEAARLASADDATRRQFLMEHMTILKHLIEQLTPEQRSTLLPGATIRIKDENGDRVIKGGE